MELWIEEAISADRWKPQVKGILPSSLSPPVKGGEKSGLPLPLRERVGVRGEEMNQ